MVQRSLCGDGNGSRTTPDPSSKRREVPWCSVRYAAMGMVQCLLSKKEQAAFPLLAEEGSGVMALRKKIWSAPLSHFSFHALLPREKSGVGSRRQYMAFVLAVQSPCTRSTTFMYSEYKAHVLLPGDAEGKKKRFRW